MFGIIAGVLTNIIGPLFTWLTSRNDAAKEEALAKINAYIESEKVQTQFKIVQFGWWGTRYLLLFIGFFTAWHYAQVMQDSGRWVLSYDIFHLLWFIPLPYPTIVQHQIGSWGIATPPGAFGDMESSIILSFFAVGAFSGAVAAGKNLITRKMEMQHEARMLEHGYVKHPINPRLGYVSVEHAEAIHPDNENPVRKAKLDAKPRSTRRKDT